MSTLTSLVRAMAAASGTAQPAPMPSSPPMPCTPSTPTPNTCTSAARVYLLIVKRNQPGLHARLAALPWRDVPVAYTRRERGHGRTERRTLKITAAARGLAFPHTAQAIQITRRRKVKGKWSGEPATPSPP
jgi:hypothetical protein